jgi:hypothetical protein
MATQGATLQRQGMHVPLWPVAALVVIAVATAITAITVRMIDDAPPAEPVTSIQETEGYWDSTVGHPTSPRGATLDAVLEARATDAWAAAIRELPAGPFHAEGRAHEVVVRSEGPPNPGFGDCYRCAQRR